MDKILVINLMNLNISDFCKACESFESDIDLIDGSNILDAKDYDHIVFISLSKNFCLSINSDDEQEILRFNKVMDKYKANKEIIDD